MSERSPFQDEAPAPLILTPAERQYLLRLLGGSLELADGFTAQDVLELRGKLEGMG